MSRDESALAPAQSSPYIELAGLLKIVANAVRSFSLELRTESDSRQQTGDQLFRELIGHVTGAVGRERLARLRRLASYLVALGDRHHFRCDPYLLEYFLDTEVQKGLSHLRHSPTIRGSIGPYSHAELRQELCDAQQQIKVEGWPARELALLDAREASDDSPSTAGNEEEPSHNAVLQRIGLVIESSPKETLRPVGRYDEMLMEFLTGAWLGLFFCGERFDILWSIVARLARNQTGAFPSGCCVYKHVGDTFRDTQERLERSWLNSSPIDARLRGKFNSLEVLVPDDRGASPCDLTPREFRHLGRCYSFWMALRYLRSRAREKPHPITLVVNMSEFCKLWSHDENAGFVMDPEVETWLKLLFGPYQRDWDTKRVDPVTGRESITASIFALNQQLFEQGDLQTGVVGLRGGVIAGAINNGELPFSGRSNSADLARTYQLGYRRLAVDAAKLYHRFRKEAPAGDFRRRSLSERRKAYFRSGPTGVSQSDGCEAINILEVLDFGVELDDREEPNYDGASTEGSAGR